jgi:hypothetical protein
MPQPYSAPGADQAAKLELSRQSTAHAIELLGDGRTADARAELSRAIRIQPDNGPARELLDEMAKSPSSLFGNRSFAYQVKPGETMAILAKRFLGDPLLFYALARYNGLAAPSNLAPGDELRIPEIGSAAARTDRPPTSKRSNIRSGTPPTAAAAAPVAHNRACAGELRGQALVEMNRGEVDHAVSHLRQALQCDAGNELASRDLDRALRLQALTHVQ